MPSTSSIAAIILVGDGQPNSIGKQDPQPYYLESDYYSVCDGDCSNADLVQMAILAADEAEGKGYDIYIVFYDEDNDDEVAEFFEGLVRGDGQFRRTPNSDELEDMMFELCTVFTELQLVM